MFNNMLIYKYLLASLLLMVGILFFGTEVDACHQTTVTEISATDNGDGTYTYELDVCMGAEDTWGFELTFTGANIVSIGSGDSCITDRTTICANECDAASDSCVEYGDYDCTSCNVFHKQGDGQACFQLTFTLDDPASSVYLYGTEYTYGPCDGSAQLTDCFSSNAVYSVDIQADSCGKDIWWDLKKNGSVAASGKKLSTDGKLYTQNICECGDTLIVNAEDKPGMSSCSEGASLCCSNGNGYMEVFDASGNSLGSGTDDGEAISLPGCTLPVELKSFDAVSLKDGVKLQWSTLQEKGSDYFAIQRKTDQTPFTTITRVEAQGTSLQKHQYQYIDHPKRGETLYYRLKQVDKNGHSQLYNTITVHRKKAAPHVELHPNPVSTQESWKVTVSGISKRQKINIYLYNRQGNSVWNKRLLLATNQSLTRITPKNDFTAGLYYLVGYGNKGMVFRKKVMIQ